MIRRGALSLLLVVFSSLAHAESTSVVVTPLRDRGLPTKEADRLEQLIVTAFASSGLRLANVQSGHLVAPHKAAAESFGDDPLARATALGRELSAPLALAVDAARLGDGVVLYLQGVDVTRGQAIASTAFSVASTPDAAALTSDLVHVLTPDRWRGNLSVSVDVVGAQVLVDGAPVVLGPHPQISLPCGTHSLRVTHPAYRDFLRFVTIDFGRIVSVDVALSKYPVDEGELRAREAALKTNSPSLAALEPLPWYRSWWVVGIASVLLLGASAAVAGVLVHDATQPRTP